MKSKTHKKKLILIITTERIVQWHLQNILARIGDFYETTVIGDQVNVHSQKYKDISFINLKIQRRIAPFRDLIALVKLILLFYKLKPDIVHSIMPKAGLLSALAGKCALVPVRVHTFTGQVWMVWKGNLQSIYKTIDKVIIVLNTKCLCDSGSQAELMRKEGIFINQKGPFVLGSGSLSGVDIERLEYNSSKVQINEILTRYNISNDTFIFAFIARKVKAKGVIDILEAFNILREKRLCKDSILILIGPDENGEIESFQKENPNYFVRVINIDSVDNVGPYLAITNVLCLPSYHEGFGSIVIDAAAMSVPSIGYRVTGLVDAIVDDVTGVLVEPGNTGDFADAMYKLYTDSKFTDKLGQEANKRVNQNFSADIVFSNWIKFYKELD
jgi:glycosyltransferase involved in cell wall biosynthesis